MKKEAFEDLLLLYGANLDLWPENERKEADLMIATQPEFALMLDQQRSFDQMVVGAVTSQTNQSAISAMVQQNLQEKRKGKIEKFIESYQGMFAVGSIGAVGGVGLGFVVPVIVDGGALISIAIGGMLP